MSYSAGPRIAKLKLMLDARTRKGDAKPGYEENVAAIRAEIARLESIIKA